MHKGRLGECVILIPKGVDGNHRVVRPTVGSKYGRKSIEDWVAGIRNSCCPKLSDHNPLGWTILSQCFRVHKSILVGNTSILNGKSMQQRRAVEEMAKGHVAHLPAAGSIPQQTAANPPWDVSTVVTLDGIHYLPLAGSQPNIRWAIGIVASIGI